MRADTERRIRDRRSAGAYLRLFSRRVTERPKKLFRTDAIVAVSTALCLAMVAPSARATFPGDSGRIVFGGTHPGGDPFERDIYSIEPDDRVQLTNNLNLDEIGPAVSPDGTKIIFWAFAPGTPADLYLMNSDGSGLRNLTDTPSVSEGNPVFSPDGRRIAFRRGIGGGDRDIWVMNLDGTGLRNVSNDPTSFDFVPSWSSDGKLIAWSKDADDSRTAIFVASPDGTGVRQLTPWNRTRPAGLVARR